MCLKNNFKSVFLHSLIIFISSILSKKKIISVISIFSINLHYTKLKGFLVMDVLACKTLENLRLPWSLFSTSVQVHNLNISNGLIKAMAAISFSCSDSVVNQQNSPLVSPRLFSSSIIIPWGSCILQDNFSFVKWGLFSMFPTFEES